MFDILNSHGPRWVVLQITEKCNLHCRMCYEWGVYGSYKGKEPAYLPIEIIEKILFEIHPFCKHIDLFGGEPTLHPDFHEIIHLINKYGFSFHIPTNGTLLDHFIPTFLEEKPDCIWVSVDGPPAINDLQRGKGTFEATIHGLKSLADAKEKLHTGLPHIGITTVITPFNYQFIKDLYFNYLNQIKLDYISIELQSWLSEDQFDRYCKFASDLFDTTDFTYAKGFVSNFETMAKLDTKQISDDVSLIKETFTNAGVKVLTRPRNFSFNTIDAYKNGNFSMMSEYNKKCVFPWLYAEINARGDVSCCHCFYDINFGNVFQNSIIDIWNNNKFSKFRSLLKKNLLPICPACCNFYLSHSPLSKH